MTNGALSAVVGGHALTLCPERAAFDPARATLLVADIHFGKAAVFRARGLPVPRGTTDDNLRRLDTLIARHDARRIVFLGDFLHAREAHAAGTLAALSIWRAQHAHLQLLLVRGNHDRHAGPPPPILGIDSVDEPYHLGPWALCHHPRQVARAYVLAGHEHPTYDLRGGGDSLRLPCFRFGDKCGVLPAFGQFTGGLTSGRARPTERVFVVAGERILEVTGQPARS